MSILIGTLAMALFNASKDPIARSFAYVYAVISIGILVRPQTGFFLSPLMDFFIHSSVIVISRRCMVTPYTNIVSP